MTLKINVKSNFAFKYHKIEVISQNTGEFLRDDATLSLLLMLPDNHH